MAALIKSLMQTTKQTPLKAPTCWKMEVKPRAPLSTTSLEMQHNATLTQTSIVVTHQCWNETLMGERDMASVFKKQSRMKGFLPRFTPEAKS